MANIYVETETTDFSKHCEGVFDDLDVPLDFTNGVEIVPDSWNFVYSRSVNDLGVADERVLLQVFAKYTDDETYCVQFLFPENPDMKFSVNRFLSDCPKEILVPLSEAVQVDLVNIGKVYSALF
jgi:hypothetical protein